jgi:ABC-type nitrate/sulfonate/bicarbonate transport system permease component
VADFRRMARGGDEWHLGHGLRSAVAIASAREATGVLFPTPLATVQAVVALLHDGALSRDVLTSLMRIGIGFALGVLVGVPLGLAMGTFRPIKIFFEPSSRAKSVEGSADIDADAPRHWFNRLLSAARWSSCLRDDPPGET